MGAVLLVVGIAASIVAVPANVLAAAWFLDEDIDIEFEPGRTLSADQILLAWVVSTPLAFFGVRRGLRLVRGRRSLVLFLRRFGYDDATSAVTFAVTRTIGSTWRLVTLDDAEIAALGVATSTRGIFRAIQLLSNAGRTLIELLLRVFPMAQLGPWITVGADLVRARIWEHAADQIEELTRRSQTKCVFICRHDRALQIAAAAASVSQSSFDDDMGRLLEMEEILAYTTDRSGIERFARALRGTLLSRAA